jgi:hypothetical protein
MILPNTRNIVIVGAFVAIAGLAVAGWMRKNDQATQYPLVAPQVDPYATSNTPQNFQPNNAPQNFQPGNAPQNYQQQPLAAVSQPVYSSADGYYPSRMRPVYTRQQQPVYAQQPTYVEQSAPGQRRVVNQQEYYTDTRGRRRGRTKAHSVEIVAGTAAAGAVIGAIAGGGKGAAIGGLSGAGAGFVYDRLTHNH